MDYKYIVYGVISIVIIVAIALYFMYYKGETNEGKKKVTFRPNTPEQRTSRSIPLFDSISNRDAISPGAQ